MNGIKLAFFLLLCCSNCKASDWTTADTERQTAITSLMFVDMMQTNYIAKHPQKFQESNLWISGNGHPRKNQVYRYFAADMLFNYFVSRELSPNPRHVWQYLYIGFEGATVAHNARIGIKFNF